MNKHFKISNQFNYDERRGKSDLLFDIGFANTFSNPLSLLRWVKVFDMGRR
jgi:hypothetical protein